MSTYWRVMSEFYDSGTVKAAMDSRECREKPRNTERRIFGMNACNRWFDSREDAGEYLDEIRRNIREICGCENQEMKAGYDF
jgi:hypothetical protein